LRNSYFLNVSDNYDTLIANMTYNDWNVSTINNNVKYMKNVMIFRFKLRFKTISS